MFVTHSTLSFASLLRRVCPCYHGLVSLGLCDISSSRHIGSKTLFLGSFSSLDHRLFAECSTLIWHVYEINLGRDDTIADNIYLCFLFMCISRHPVIKIVVKQREYIEFWYKLLDIFQNQTNKKYLFSLNQGIKRPFFYLQITQFFKMQCLSFYIFSIFRDIPHVTKMSQSLHLLLNIYLYKTIIKELLWVLF